MFPTDCLLAREGNSTGGSLLPLREGNSTGGSLLPLREGNSQVDLLGKVTLQVDLFC